MAESRDQTLIDFQAVTGIDDFDLSTSILTQHDWNLERAVNGIMGFDPTDGFPPDEIGPSPGEPLNESSSINSRGLVSERSMEGFGVHLRPSDHGASDMASGPSYSSSPLNFALRMISFNVEYRDKNINVVLPDNETVGRIKEVLEEDLGIPKSKQQLKGLVKRKVDDSTILRDLFLPRENSLYLLTPDILNPTINKSQSQEGEGTSQGLEGEREYMLKITLREGTKHKQLNIKFDCNKTVGDVKQAVSTLTSISVQHQEWSGWAKPVSDDDKLFSCDLSFPTHCLELTKAGSTERPKAPDPEDMDEDSDCEEEAGLENYSLEDDLFSQEPDASRRIEPLMPEGITDDKEALEHFTKEFSSRYGDCHPQFFIGSLDDAIQQSLAIRATERKLLAIYLHHDSSIFSNVFCSQLLCAEGIVNYLSVHFITWAWDLTTTGNATRLIQLATRHFGSLAAAQMRSYTPEQLPSLILISRAKATNEVIDAIQGHVTLDEMMTRLIHAVDVFQGQKQADVGEEKEREARERIKQEQDMAYQESLTADRKKAEAMKVEADKQREEMERLIEEQRIVEHQKNEEKMLKEAISKSIATTVPDEPAENSPGRICCLRFRVPMGEVITRRFFADNSLEDLLNFLTACGFHTVDYKVITTFPRRDISALDKSLHLEDLKLYPQETLILEER